jgi:hypothetical protein
MLTTPATDDARAFNAKVTRLADVARYRELDALEALWKGLQYDGKASFWDTDTPLHERAPCVRGHCAEIAATSLIPLVFGEGRFPAATVGNGGPDLAGITLAPEESAALAAAFESIVKQAKLRLRMREGLEHGLMARTCVFVSSLRASRLRVDVVPAKWCTPTFDPQDDERVTSLDIRYRYAGVDDQGRAIHLWYRRLIAETSDTTFLPALCDPDGYDPEWIPDPSKTFATEFCAVDWVKNLAKAGKAGDIDGSALFEGKAQEVKAIDLALSMHHRNGVYNGDPKMLITGASPGELVGDAGREAMRTDVPGYSWFNQVGSMVSGVFKPRTTGGASAIKMAPGKPLFLPKPDADGKLLESSGAGAKILEDDASGNEKRLFDAIGVVKINPADISSNATGEFLKKLAAPMLARCDDLRECWGDALVRVVGTCFRLLTTQVARVEGVFLPGFTEVSAILPRFLVTTRHGVRWFNPPLELTWGPYFEPSQQERQSAVGWATQATGNGPVLSLRTVVQEIAPIMGIRDVEAELGALGVATTDSHAKVQEMLGSLVPQASVDPAAAPHAKDPTTALNGAQVSSLQEIVAAVASRQLPRASGVAMMLAAFPIDGSTAERIMGDVGVGFFTAPPPEHEAALAALQDEHAALKASHAGKSNMLANVLAKNAAGELVQGSPIGAGNAAPQAEQPAADAAPAKDATP